MIALSLYLPRLSTDLARKRSQLDPNLPILLAREEHQREIVAACCHHAERAGVAAGMTISQAKALLPNGRVHQEPWDEAWLRRMVRRLAVRAVRFTPRVMPDRLDGLWLDCAGCTHLHGGTKAMAVNVGRHFASKGLACRVGVAPFMGAAWAVARFGSEPLTIIEAGGVDVALATLPVAALRIADEQIEALHLVGIVTIADLVKVPRSALAERFGGEVVRRLDQAFGRETEQFDSVRTRPPHQVGMAFAGPTDRPESIALAVQQILQTLCGQLAKREAGCRELLLTLRRSDLPPFDIIVRATNPTRDAKHWFTLLRSPLEQAHLGFGVEGVELLARSVVTLSHKQTTRWIDTREREQTEELARLADTIKARLGEESVLQLHLRASHLPERSWAAGVAALPYRGAAPAAEAPTLDRPTLLLPHPLPIDVVFLFPEGPIGSLARNGERREVLRCRGPERISAEWWRREAGTRDYYQLQTDDGAWLWVFRCCESGRWFLHGEWA